MTFSEDEKQRMITRLDELLWGECRPFIDDGKVVLHQETVRALVPLWGDRWVEKWSTMGHLDRDRLGTLFGPHRDVDQAWQIYTAPYVEPTAVHFRTSLRQRTGML